MRTSTDPNDPGYKNYVPGKWEVLLNGRSVKGCVTADEERGLVVLHRYDDAGKPFVVNGEVERLTFHGKVKIREIRA